ncbi:MAG: intradiol ring-cleavage dioxygenase [Candidatus Hydrogenedentes bacterium]|nr:intradiol ring-cleavage dioxygenase [Candidatus Hydrogenedentota bacterium]
MNTWTHTMPRRAFLKTVGLGAAAWMVPGAFAEMLTPTPRQTAGPFYPDRLPLDTDNDLLIIRDSTTPAVGQVTHVSGRVLSVTGEPIRNALVEIWQADNNGVYLHTASPGGERRDRHFQGYGRFETDSTGAYRFRTIKPVPYAQGAFQRTPHIHFAVHAKGQGPFTTQCYVRGHPLNARDSVLRAITNIQARDAVLVDFVPDPASAAGELTARFDIVLGREPVVRS